MAYFFAQSGTRVSPQIDVSHIDEITASRVCWEATVDGWQTLTIETRISTDNGSTWTAWAECTNYDPIPDLSDYSTTATTIECKQTLTTTNRETTPILEKLTIIINNNFFANVTQGGAEIRITEEDGVTELPREVVLCEPIDFNGEVHFLGDYFSSSEYTDFYVYYGLSGEDYPKNHQYGTHSVWPSSYLMVHHLAEPSASDALDSTSNLHHGSINGATFVNFAVRDEEDYTLHEGLTDDGGTLYFDGTNDYIDIPASDTVLAPDKITATAWIYAERFRDYDTIIGKGWVGEGYSLRYFEDGAGIFSVHDGADWYEAESAPGMLQSETWHKITGTFDENNVVLYIDGQWMATVPANFSRVKRDAHVGLGAEASDSFNRKIKGALDEVRIMSTAQPCGFEETEYNNQGDPETFWLVFDEEEYQASTYDRTSTDEVIFSDVVDYEYLKGLVGEDNIIFTDVVSVEVIEGGEEEELGWIIDNVIVKYKLLNRSVSGLVRVATIDKYPV